LNYLKLNKKTGRILMKARFVHYGLITLDLGNIVALTGCSGCDSHKTIIEEKSAEEAQPLAKKKQPGSGTIKTLPSGLGYETTQTAPANARAAQKGNKVTVHYTGYLNVNGQKGKVFDSSVTRGPKFSFMLGAGQVIKGWDEGIQNMRIGEKRTLYIPANLAYGNRAMGNQIPANSDLIFDVELFEVQ
jgi:FKBP-type peptidyl-prolyl cis-trans isomerase